MHGVNSHAFLCMAKKISQHRNDAIMISTLSECVFQPILISLCPLFVGGSWECGDDWFKWISRTKGESEPTNRPQNIPGKVYELHLGAV